MTNEEERKVERRAAGRRVGNIEVEWEGLVGRKDGTISDLSTLGCFVLCSGEVETGETVKVFIPIGEGMKVQFWGEVVNHVFEIGFGIKFIELNRAQTEFLDKLLESLNK